jgi:mercuric ion transport protein
MNPSNEPGLAQPRTPLGYLWAGLAFVTCPCHLPILAVALSGTAFGALLSEHLGVVLLAGTLLFVAFVSAALRSWRS